MSEADLDRLRGPVGLDLGGRAPAETALAILAEIVAERYGGSGAPMRERAEAGAAVLSRSGRRAGGAAFGPSVKVREPSADPMPAPTITTTTPGDIEQLEDPVVDPGDLLEESHGVLERDDRADDRESERDEAGGSGNRSGSSGSAAARITSAASRMNVMTSAPARRNQNPMVTLPSQPIRTRPRRR